MENLNSNRQINLELLRIVSMIFIILAHYAGHGGVAEIALINSNRLIGSFLEIGGRLGTNLFILITGYFFMKSNFDKRKILKTILQVLFYSVIFGLVVPSAVYKKTIPIKQIIKSIFPIIYKTYWFPTVYIVICLFSTFIKSMISSLSKEEFKNILKIFFVTLVVVPTFFIGSSTFVSDLSVMLFVCFIGIYISKYKYEIKSLKLKNEILIMLLMVAIIYISQVVLIFISEKHPIIQSLIPFLRRSNSLPMVLLSITIFNVFRKLTINRNGALILILAKTSFGVYLFHDNPFFKDILWHTILRTQDFYYCNIIFFFLHIIISTIVIYATGTVIELIRIELIDKRLLKKIDLEKFKIQILRRKNNE